MTEATAAIFAALRSFGRPATRRELEIESGLAKASVEAALRTLKKAGALVANIEHPRARGLYALKPDAICPAGRGKYDRAAFTR